MNGHQNYWKISYFIPFLLLLSQLAELHTFTSVRGKYSIDESKMLDAQMARLCEGYGRGSSWFISCQLNHPLEVTFSV